MFFIFSWYTLTLFALTPSSGKIPDYPVQFSVYQFDTNKLAIAFENYPAWHTYWKNPGDAGKAIEVSFTLNDQPYILKELPWPVPYKYIEEGNLLAYGYEGQYVLFYQLNEPLPEGLFSIHAKWLVCRDICIPGEGKVESRLRPIEVSHPKKFSFPQENLQDYFKKLPQIVAMPPSYFSLFLTKAPEGAQVYFQYTFEQKEQSSLPPKQNLVYPFPSPAFTFKHEKLFRSQLSQTQIDGVIPADWDGEYLDPPQTLPTNGQFDPPLELQFLVADQYSDQYFVVTQKISQFDIHNLKNLDQLYENFVALQAPNNSATKQSHPLPWWQLLMLAFLGGLILNIMPCVLPVISLKLFGLFQHAGLNRRQIFKHNFIYTAGVLFTFFLLASIIVVIKMLGHEVGWGFQMQNPYFLISMIIVMLAFTGNLFGWYEIPIPGLNFFGQVKQHQGIWGDFTSGVLAVILATPCSAPFLGTALAFALTTTFFNIYWIFFWVGLGLSFPFLVTAAFPVLVNFLPQPGQWMLSFKKVMGLSMLAVAIWLGSITMTILSPEGGPRMIEKAQAIGLPWQPWSENAMNNLKGELVFIDFTAQWCFTCKVNERLVLNTSAFKNLVMEKNVKLLLADWTKYDDSITQFLRRQNLVGIPAYFVQKKDGSLISLGETITIKKIEQALLD